MIDALGHALSMALAMGWEILWPLILGFTLSAVVQAIVSHREMSKLLPDDRPRSIATALALGAASSSCSYAAVALARSVFRKGANFTAAMAFEMASTNLVLELSIIMLVLMGWRFALAEFVGAPIMVVLLVYLFRRFLDRDLLDQAKEQAEKGVKGRMEGHAEMDMSVTEGGSLWQRLTSERSFTAISHYFVMDWAAVWLDIAGGLLIAGALAAWVPHTFLAVLLPDWSSGSRDPLGSHRRPARRGHLFRLLGWQYSAGRGPVERRHQFRRGYRVHLRRSNHHPDPGHLSEVLRAEDGRFPVRHILRCDGSSGAIRRGDLRRSRSHPGGAPCTRGRDRHHMELHDVAQHRLARRRCLAGLAFPADWRIWNVADDEPAGRVKPCSSCALV
jgi:uncharacterized membrane protein YraQ (UPF0718 family)